MAESNDQERTEQPTEKRLSDSREKGQVPRSRDLTTMLLLIVSSAAMILMGEGMIREMLRIMHYGFTIPREEVFDTAAMITRLYDMCVDALLLLVPLFAMLVIIALIAPMLVGGWNFSVSAMEFKFEKLDPIQGLGRVFGIKGLVEMVKGLLKFILVALVAGWLLWSDMEELLGLTDEPVAVAIAHTGEMMLHAFLILSAVLIFIAAIDVPYQLWDYIRNLRMSFQEIKEEFKQTEGSPEVKGRIRRLQMEMSRRRMMEAVPTADVVVTNPSHFAVALKYDATSMGAPKVVAMGADLVAAQIRALASEHSVPLLEAPPLARALYYNADLDQEIPAGLYFAVAQVLAYIYQLKTYAEQGGYKPAPLATEQLPIPDELRRD